MVYLAPTLRNQPGMLAVGRLVLVFRTWWKPQHQQQQQQHNSNRIPIGLSCPAVCNYRPLLYGGYRLKSDETQAGVEACVRLLRLEWFVRPRPGMCVSGYVLPCTEAGPVESL